MNNNKITNFSESFSSNNRKRRVSQIVGDRGNNVKIDYLGLRNCIKKWNTDAADLLVKELESIVDFWQSWKQSDSLDGVVTETSGDVLRRWLFKLPTANSPTKEYPSGVKFKKYYRPDIGDLVLTGLPVLDLGISIKNMASPDLITHFGWTEDSFNEMFRRPRKKGSTVRKEWFYGSAPVTRKPTHFQKFHAYAYATGQVYVKVKHSLIVNGQWCGPDISKPGAIEIGIFARNTVEQFVGGIDRDSGRRIISNVPTGWVDSHADAIASAKAAHNATRDRLLRKKGKAVNKVARKSAKKRLPADKPEELDWVKSPQEAKLVEKARSMYVPDLRKIAADSGLSNYKKLRKEDLIKLLITNGVI